VHLAGDLSTPVLNRLLKNRVSGRDPALRGFYKCAAHPADGGTALSKTPRAWFDGPILVLQLPVKR